MEVVSYYIANRYSWAFIPHFNENGELQTIVLERDRLVLVTEKPYRLMDQNLRHFGSSMRGAKDGVSSLLGKTNMAPVALHGEEPMVFLPTNAIKDDSCVWLNVQAYLDCKETAPKETLIELVGGHTIALNIQRDKIYQRVFNAYVLLAMLQIRSKVMQERPRTKGQTYHFSRDLNELNFKVITKNKDILDSE